LICSYERYPLPADVERELIAFAQREAKLTRLDGLPGILNPKLAHRPG
jgi:hypothetical protein